MVEDNELITAAMRDSSGDNPVTSYDVKDWYVRFIRYGLSRVTRTSYQETLVSRLIRPGTCSHEGCSAGLVIPCTSAWLGFDQEWHAASRTQLHCWLHVHHHHRASPLMRSCEGVLAILTMRMLPHCGASPGAAGCAFGVPFLTQL
jgi:hypothetical protein